MDNKSERWRSIRLGIFVLSYLLIGIYNSVWTHYRFEYAWDFAIYYQKANAAQAGQSAYFPYLIGTNFLYYPSTLTLLTTFTWLNEQAALVAWLAASVIVYCVSVYLLFRMYLKEPPSIC